MKRGLIVVEGVLVIAAVLMLIVPFAELAYAKGPAAGGSLVGFIFAEDMKTPVVNAVVKIRDFQTAKEYVSLPTDANGMYTIAGIKEGRYILGVTTATGNFNFDFFMHLKGEEMAKLSVALAPGGQTSGGDGGTKAFFKENWAGILVLAGLVGAVLFNALEENGGAKSREVSPIR